MSEDTSPARTGAIHDIGYRHYDGPRLGASYIRRSLFVETLRGAYGLGRSARSKVMPFLLLAVMVLPAVVMGIVTSYFGVDVAAHPLHRVRDPAAGRRHDLPRLAVARR